jgi:hypothetical protein
MSNFSDQDKFHWYSIILWSLWYFAEPVDSNSQYCCEIHFDIKTSSKWIHFPSYLSWPSLMLFTHPRWSIPVSTASIILFEPGFCLTICLNVQCLSLRRLSSYPAISSLLDHFISLSLCVSLSLPLSPSRPLWPFSFWTLISKTSAYIFSLSQRKGFNLLSERNYFWRILSCGMWRPVVME